MDITGILTQKQDLDTGTVPDHLTEALTGLPAAEAGRVYHMRQIGGT